MTDLTPAIFTPPASSEDYFANAMKSLDQGIAAWQGVWDRRREDLGAFFYDAAIHCTTKEYNQLMAKAVEGFSLSSDTITRYRTLWQKNNELPAPNAKSANQQRRSIGTGVSARDALTETISVNPDLIVNQISAGGLLSPAEASASPAEPTSGPTASILSPDADKPVESGVGPEDTFPSGSAASTDVEPGEVACRKPSAPGSTPSRQGPSVGTRPGHLGRAGSIPATASVAARDWTVSRVDILLAEVGQIPSALLVNADRYLLAQARHKLNGEPLSVASGANGPASVETFFKREVKA